MSAVAAPRYPRYKRVSTVIVLAIFALWVGYLLLGTDAKAAGTGIPNGAKAPDFELKTTDGTAIKLSDLKGKAVMLNFFATWCPPCRAEMPALQEVYKEYEAKGFVVLAINLNESNLAVNQFRDKLGLTFPIVIDKDDHVSKLYDIVPLPTSYFINKDGVVVGKWTGEITKEKLRSFVKQIAQ
ncbi:MAG TPA: thiol-disulfide oxidoreductase ResA [Symbiobacteriaceae bacterium]|nr:thiol-disulfide oxidoreductase ResA [Symbiobacteriaceae bacterium]